MFCLFFSERAFTIKSFPFSTSTSSPPLISTGSESGSDESFTVTLPFRHAMLAFPFSSDTRKSVPLTPAMVVGVFTLYFSPLESFFDTLEKTLPFSIKISVFSFFVSKWTLSSEISIDVFSRIFMAFSLK